MKGKFLRIFRPIMVAVIVFMLSSCSLELGPISQISSSSFWNTEADASGALNGMYGRLRTVGTIVNQGGSELFILGESRSETMGYSTGNAGGYANYFLNVLDLNMSGPSWINLYTLVHSANLMLKYVPKITFASENTKNSYLAQAYAMRAFTYFVMVRTWGAVPLRLEPLETVDPVGIHIPRAEKAEVFKIIKSDIEEALKLFSNNSYSNGRAQWSKPAVNALKAEVYLWTGKRESGGAQDFQTVLSALNEIEGTDVALLSEFQSVFSYANKGNKEILFAIRLLELESGANENGFQNSWIMSFPSNVSQATKDLVGITGGTELWTASSTLRTKYANDDLRKNATFYEIYNGPAYHNTVITKFRGMISSGTRKFIDDVVIYRYADVLLMKAEAKNALGQDPSDEINQVRRRAYGINYPEHVFTSTTKEQNDALILNERLLELAFEGKRWWDLVRFGKAFDLVPSLADRKNQDHLLLFPISRAVLTSEPKVTPNPGYQ